MTLSEYDERVPAQLRGAAGAGEGAAPGPWAAFAAQEHKSPLEATLTFSRAENGHPARLFHVRRIAALLAEAAAPVAALDTELLADLASDEDAEVRASLAAQLALLGAICLHTPGRRGSAPSSPAASPGSEPGPSGAGSASSPAGSYDDEAYGYVSDVFFQMALHLLRDEAPAVRAAAEAALVGLAPLLRPADLRALLILPLEEWCAPGGEEDRRSCATRLLAPLSRALRGGPGTGRGMAPEHRPAGPDRPWDGMRPVLDMRPQSESGQAPPASPAAAPCSPAVQACLDAALAAAGPAQSPSDLEAWVCPIVRRLAADGAFGLRRAAAEMLPVVAAALGPGRGASFALPLHAHLCEDAVWAVRRAAADASDALAAALLGGGLAGGALAAYAEIDGRRRLDGGSPCARGPPVAPAEVQRPEEPIDPDAVASSLLDSFERLANDVSAAVRAAALARLGPLLALLPASAATPSVVSFFTSQALAVGHEGEMALSCAYSLPAVAAALGPARWSELAEAHSTLAASADVRVRTTLAASLPHIASTLGPQRAAEELAAVLEAALSDSESCVRLMALSHLSEALTSLPTAARAPAVAVALRTADPPPEQALAPDALGGGGAGTAERCARWREREALAYQLGRMAEARALSPQQLTAEVLPVALRLCRDGTAAVRTAAAEALGLLLSAAGAGAPGGTAADAGDAGAMSRLLSAIQALALSPRHQDRLAYVAAVRGLLASPTEGHNLAASGFLPLLLALAGDHVANVRLALAQLLTQPQAPAAGESRHGPSPGASNLLLLPPAHGGLGEDGRVAGLHCGRCRARRTACLLDALADVREAREVLAADSDAEVRSVLARWSAAGSVCGGTADLKQRGRERG